MWKRFKPNEWCTLRILVFMKYAISMCVSGWKYVKKSTWYYINISAETKRMWRDCVGNTEMLKIDNEIVTFKTYIYRQGLTLIYAYLLTLFEQFNYCVNIFGTFIAYPQFYCRKRGKKTKVWITEKNKGQRRIQNKKDLSKRFVFFSALFVVYCYRFY